MILVASVEHRFAGTPDGAVWTQTQFARPSWAPCLRVFDGVRVVARVQPVDAPPADWVRADGDAVTFAKIPYYVGPRQYLWRRGAIRRAAAAALGPSDALILRVPSPIGGHLEAEARRRGQPFGVKVVGDPHDVFAPGATTHPLAPLFRWHFARTLRRTCRRAALASYVTRFALQRRYPCPAGETHFSEVRITDDALAPGPRPRDDSARRRRLLLVGTLEQLYKAPDVVIDAFASLVHGGLDLELAFVGDGQHRPMLEQRARDRGVGERVLFLGSRTAGPAVRAELDRADLFVLPSRQEGLPRAMIEAMARGLPCVGSTVGGIPELLASEDLVPPGDAEALARTLRALIANPARMAEASARNLRTAGEYHIERMEAARQAFYEDVRGKTEAWLAARARPAFAT